MDLRRGVALHAAVLAIFVLGFAAASFISSDALLDHGHGATGRRLLQAKKECPMSFEYSNYSIITSRCKGPQYQPALCCNAFKDFACPYSTYINDDTTICAASMFSYINLYGKYPLGLFASICHEGDKGLSCPEDNPQPGPALRMKGLMQTLPSMMVALGCKPGKKASGTAAITTPTVAVAMLAALAMPLIMCR